MLIKPNNIPGRHCGSSGLRNLVNFHGLEWTEAMCFGLGAGLGIWVVRSKKPSRMIHVRSADLEKAFFVRIGQPLDFDRFDDPAQSEKALIAKLDQGLPAIVQTDIYDLPYYNSNTHFPGHVITVWGYDMDKKVFFVTDTERPDLIEVAFENMAKARFCGDGFFDVKGNCMAPDTIKPPEDMNTAITWAITADSTILMDNAWNFQGVFGLKNCLEELDKWSGFEDWKWTARFAYQILEKRGTGGGAFRLMYADFLDEAQEFTPRVRELGLQEMMRGCAADWTRLSLAFKDVSEMDSPDFSKVREDLEAVINSESQYHKAALTL